MEDKDMKTLILLFLLGNPVCELHQEQFATNGMTMRIYTCEQDILLQTYTRPEQTHALFYVVFKDGIGKTWRDIEEDSPNGNEKTYE